MLKTKKVTLIKSECANECCVYVCLLDCKQKYSCISNIIFCQAAHLIIKVFYLLPMVEFYESYNNYYVNSFYV